MNRARRSSNKRGHFSVAASCALVSALLVVPAATALPTKTFVSKRYAYSITLPGKSSRWSAHFATDDWSSNSIGGIGSAAIDTFSDLLTGRSYLLAAQPTTADLGQWTQFVISARSPRCGAPKSSSASTLAGVPARIATWSCTDGYRVIVIAALHAQRGYFMLVASPTILSRASDSLAFNIARRSFRFLSG